MPIKQKTNRQNESSPLFLGSIHSFSRIFCESPPAYDINTSREVSASCLYLSGLEIQSTFTNTILQAKMDQRMNERRFCQSNNQSLKYRYHLHSTDEETKSKKPNDLPRSRNQ